VSKMEGKANFSRRLQTVTVGLASHWPCVTDNSGITTYGLMALEREMGTPPIPTRSVAQFTFLFFCRLSGTGIVEKNHRTVDGMAT